MVDNESLAAKATRSLARFVVKTHFNDLHEHTKKQAAWVTADTIGVALSGSAEPEMLRLYERLRVSNLPKRDWPATVFRPEFPRLSADTASFLNATAICFLELDEGSRPTGHPALHVLPSALAYAQQQRVRGSDFITALVLGYEVQARIQKASKLRSIVHPHGNYGHLGAIAALGKLANWNEEQMYQGLLSATALVMGTSWQPCLAGATVRNAYPGITAQTAFTTKSLVEAGFTGYDGALAETFGEILGTDFYADLLVQGLGSSYAIEENYFKFHAACALTHPVLDAVARALSTAVRTDEYPVYRLENSFTVDDIENIEVQVLERSLRLNVSARPNQLSSKFSIPFAVATFLVYGDTDPRRFRDDALIDERVLRIQARVRVQGNPDMAERWPSEHPAVVKIRLSDGRELEGGCSNPYGSVSNEASVESLKAKFDALTARVLSKEASSQVWQQCLEVAECEDLSRFLL